MNCIRNRPSSIASACVAIAIATATAAEPFAELSLDNALNQAGDQKKLVVALVTQKDCDACNNMETRTFADRGVVAWLEKHALTVRVDAERSPELIKQHDVVEFPTVLFLRPDGSVADRFAGERDGLRFVKFASAVAEGRDSLSAARGALTREKQNDPHVRVSLARALIDHRRDAEALEQLLWCFDEGHRQPGTLGEGFRPVRLSYLLGDLTRLAKIYPPAREALLRRRDAAREKVLAGTADRDQTAEFTALNRAMGQDGDTLAVFDQVRKEHPDSQTLAYLRLRVFGALLEQRRYVDINESFDVLIDAAHEFQKYESFGNLMRDLPQEGSAGAQRGNMRDAQRRVVIQKECEYYEVLLGVGRVDDAVKLAERLLAFDKSAVAYHGLALAALRAGKAGQTHLQYARTALDAAGGAEPELVGTVAQLMAQLGRRAEAVDFIKEKLGSVTDEGAKLRLRALADGLRSEARPPVKPGD